MERLTNPEIKQTSTIQDLFRQQLETEWMKASEELKLTTERLETVMTLTVEQLRQLDHSIGTPSVIATLDTWTTEYDTYTYGEKAGSRQSHVYQVQTDNLSSVFEALSTHISNDKTLLYKATSHDLMLTQIGLQLANGEVIYLDHECYKAQWHQDSKKFIS
jgi:hypothetical protein